jgi:leucine dehydrogenase
MTFKAAITGLNIARKSCYYGDAKLRKTPELMRKFGEFVHGLSGRYITAEDEWKPEIWISLEMLPYVTGI